MKLLIAKMENTENNLSSAATAGMVEWVLCSKVQQNIVFVKIK